MKLHLYVQTIRLPNSELNRRDYYYGVISNPSLLLLYMFACMQYLSNFLSQTPIYIGFGNLEDFFSSLELDWRVKVERLLHH